MSDQPCTCSTCSETIHVYYDKSSAVKPLKLLEQAHCGHCWRPLRVATSWPGPRRGQSQPYGNGGSGRSIVVAQCGHLYHGNCAGKASHCALCFSTIEKLVPLHYQERSNRPDCRSKSQQGSKVDSRKDAQESETAPEDKDESGVGKNLEELISSLRDKIERISEEVISLRRQLTRRPPPPANRWRWTNKFDAKKQN